LPIFPAKVTAKDMASIVAGCFDQKMMIVVKKQECLVLTFDITFSLPIPLISGKLTFK
jgi:hypothetical protein